MMQCVGSPADLSFFLTMYFVYSYDVVVLYFLVSILMCSIDRGTSMFEYNAGVLLFL